MEGEAKRRLGEVRSKRGVTVQSLEPFFFAFRATCEPYGLCHSPI